MPHFARVSIPRFAAMLAAASFLLTARTASAQAGSAAAAAKPAGMAAHAQSDTVRVLMRFRVLGVYDDQTGAPIEGADVTDMITGFTVRTTATGTAAIYYTDGPGTLVTIKKLGYQRALIAVTTLPTDTIPVTTTLLRAGQVLVPVIVVGNRAIRLSKSDTISTLLQNGFYERRETRIAPRSAFITGDQLQGTMLTTDARYFGRGICETNLYIDGAPFRVPKRTGRFLKEGIDGVIDPSEIAGIETYTFGEAPVGTAHTIEGAGALDIGATMAASAMDNAAATIAAAGCVTMIWLRH